MSKMPRIFRAGLIVGLLTVAFTPLRAEATPELRTEMKKLSKALHAFLKENKAKEIAVKQFLLRETNRPGERRPSDIRSASGPALQQMLVDEMKALGVGVTQQAQYEVRGSYEDVLKTPPGGTGPLTAIAIFVEIYDTNNGKKQEGLSVPPITLREEDSILTILPGNFQPPAPNPADIPPSVRRDEKIRRALFNPMHPTIKKDGLVQPGPESPYAMVILVDGQPRVPVNKDGQAFVELKRGETYSVKLINNSKEPVAAKLALDGINMFAFSEVRQPDGTPAYAAVIVAKESFVILDGWHKNDTTVWKFLITEYANSAAAKVQAEAVKHPTVELLSDNQIGTIGVQYFRTWPANEKPPADEPNPKTGFDQEFPQNFERVDMKIGSLRGTVTLRYERPR